MFRYGGQWSYYTDSFNADRGSGWFGSTDLVFMTHRYYEPGFGKFQTRDPIGYKGGINLYGFVGNNPITHRDPSGWEDIDPDDPLGNTEEWERNPGEQLADGMGSIPSRPEPKVSNPNEDKWYSPFEDLYNDVFGRGSKRSSSTAPSSGGAIKPAPQGWKVGQPINKPTARGNTPSWGAVRARYWKNEAYNNSGKYDATNLARMKKGLAPQRVNFRTGRVESMELHHNPPQRRGGLYQVEPVWPDEHAVIDPYRHTGN